MNEEQLRRLMISVSNVVAEQFSPSGQLPAQIFAVDANFRPAILQAHFTSVTDEKAFRIGVPKSLRRQNYAAWVFVSEAWTAPYSVPGPLPAERPDRMEVIVFAGEAPACGDARFITKRQVWRDGKTARLLPLVFSGGNTLFVTVPERAAEGARP